MKKFRETIKNYFSLSEKEANGFVIFCFFMLLVIAFPWVHRIYLDKTTSPPNISITTMDVMANHEEAKDLYNEKPEKIRPFDPNSADLTTWKSVGLSEKIASRIDKYKAAGGRFKVKGDLKKIYGFPEDLYYKLHTYILLPDSVSASNVRETKFSSTNISKLNLNEASLEEFEKLKGIGPVLAQRILKFRNSLGGFVSKEQLYEVYGLDTSIARQVILNSFILPEFSPQKIEINTATVEELDKHPYIDKKTAWALYKYRSNMGPFTNEKALIASEILPAEKIKKMGAYIQY